MSSERGGLSYERERELNSRAAVVKSREARTKKGLKVEVKAATAFVKKVSTLSDEAVPGLIKDVNEKLNLTRFVEEVVAALVNAPLKLKDVEGATALCCAMHQNYDEFAEPLVGHLLEQFEKACKIDEKAEIARRRILLRWLGELYLVGIADGDPQLPLKLVRVLTRAGSPPGPLPEPLPETFPPLPEQACLNLSAVSAFVKALGSELLGSSNFPAQQIKSKLNGLLIAFTKGAIVKLKEERTGLRRLKRRVDNEALKRGEVSSDASDALERSEKICDELYTHIVPLCDVLGLEKPISPQELKEQEEARKEAEEEAIAEKVGLELMSRRKEGDAELSFESWIWGDDATRAFYENLDDLLLVTPRMILERPDQALQPSVVERLKNSGNSALITPAAPTNAEPETTGTGEEDTTATDEIDNPDAIQVVETDEDEPTGMEGPKSEAQVKEQVTRPVEELMARLPEMTSERLVDAFARDFAQLNSKSARKRLVQELFNVPWGRTELLPYYARLTATLSKVYVGIGRPLVDSVRNAFFRCTRDHRAGSRLNSRLRYAKYLGELVKFGLKCPQLECPPAAAFRALRQTMDFFQGENIDMACALVETCGRELYRTPRTHTEMAKLLESLQRNRVARNLSPTQDALVDNAYYHCIPVDNATASQVRRARRDRGEIEIYVRYLLIERLGEHMVETNANENKIDKKASKGRPPSKAAKGAQLGQHELDILASMVRLPWTTNYDECEDAVSRAVIASCKHRAGTLPLVCNVVSVLSRKLSRLGPRIVEDLLETIIHGVETNDIRHNQRRIGQMKCLAYLFRCNLITPALFFDTLFMILHYGHQKPQQMLASLGIRTDTFVPSCTFSNAQMFHPAVPFAQDPPWDAFRVRLVCAALETAGERVITQTVTPRLDNFVKYLERYVWNKAYVSIDVEYYMLDVLQELERKYNSVAVGRGKKGSKSSRARAKAKGDGAVLGALQLVGRAPTRQSAEDQISTLEGSTFQSELKVSDTIIEEEEDEEDEEDDEEDMEEEDEDEDDDEEEDDEEEEETPPLQSPRVQSRPLKPAEPTPEDIAFEQEFAKLMKETLEQSSKSHLGAQAYRGDNLAIPLGILRKTQGGNPKAPTPISNGEGVTLNLLKRGPNKKIEVKTLVVPETSELAKSALAQEDSKREKRAEEEAIKQLTLRAAAATTTRMREAGDL